MKNIISLLIFFLFIAQIGFGQSIHPKYEKQNNLTKATYFYENGKVKETGYFKNTKLQGKWLKFDTNGEITTVANYKNGKKEGVWYVIINDTVKELTYKSNKLIKVKGLQNKHLPFI